MTPGGTDAERGPPHRPGTMTGLSKSKFVKGWQCHALLWWSVHEPRAKELKPGKGLLDRFRQGHEVGALARERFPGGVMITGPFSAKARRVRSTVAAIASGAPAIFEASFVADDVFVAVDVLERNGDAFNLIEVKSSTGVRDEHIPDIAVQAHVLRESGVPLARVEVMHMNADFRRPNWADLFVRADVSTFVDDIIDQVPAEIEAQHRLLAGELPATKIGLHCATMYECPFRRRCWPDDKDHILNLHGKGVRKALELMAEGIHSIRDLPRSMRLSDVAERQRLAVVEGRMVVDPSLAEQLAGLELPLGFLDFETVSRAIPPWDNLPPWGAVPAQFSYHEQGADGPLRHTGWVAKGPDDPSEPLALALIKACRSAEKIVVYTSFEERQLGTLQERCPHLANDLEAIRGKLVDLYAIVRGSVYHPDFRGSLSIKSVLPALVPDLSYAELAIQDGLEASVDLARLLLHGDSMTVIQRRRLRADLEEYCRRDTLAMVRLVERLLALC